MAGAEDVADHASDAGVGAAEGLDGRRMIVSLGLEGEGFPLHEGDGAGIPVEGGAHELGIDPFGGVAELAQQGGGGDPIDGDRGPERLVCAVLAPSLGQRFQLDVGRVAHEGDEVIADHDELLGIEGQRPFDVQRREAVGFETAHRHDLDETRVLRSGMKHWLDAMRRPSFDHRVGDDAAEQGVPRVFGATRWELDAPTCCRRRHRHDELPPGIADRFGGGIGDPRMKGDLEGIVVVRGDLPGRRLQERIGQEVGEALALVCIEVTFDEDDVAHSHLTAKIEVVGGCGSGDRCSSRVFTNRRDGQSRPGWHWPDPTTPIGVFPAIGVSRARFPGT